MIISDNPESVFQFKNNPGVAGWIEININIKMHVGELIVPDHKSEQLKCFRVITAYHQNQIIPLVL